MKKIKALLASIFLLPIATLAGDLNSSTAFYDIHYYGYEEPGVMTVKSKIPALTIGYRDETAIRSSNGSTTGMSFNIEGTIGHTEYNGSGTHSHNFYKFMGELYAPVLGNVYAGLGYRRLLDDFGPGRTSTNAATYDRLSQYFYLPIGAVLKVADGASTKLQFNYFIKGRQISYLTQVSGYYNDADNTQDSGYGVDLSYTAPKGNWEAYIRYWNIGSSDLVLVRSSGGSSYVYEPKNNTIEIGIRASF